MWVEADCNVTGGESLVRQLFYGKRYFKQQFNVESRILWLPDVFGYAAAMPQLLKLAGVDYFLTQKISWSELKSVSSPPSAGRATVDESAWVRSSRFSIRARFFRERLRFSRARWTLVQISLRSSKGLTRRESNIRN